MPKLAIVITCTDRKRVPPRPELRVRDLPSGSPSERSRAWSARVAEAPSAGPLELLYRGEAWSKLPDLVSLAAAAGFAPDVFVASAGLGLRRLRSAGPSYSATFTPGQTDSVAATGEGRQEWWSGLRQLPGALDHLPRSIDASLLILSSPYAAAMSVDLERLGATGKQVVLFGGVDAVPGVVRIASNASLRLSLGGTLNSLNIRMASRWLAALDEPVLYSQRSHDRWTRWARKSAHPERWDRVRLSDDGVREFIRAELEARPDSTRSALLRHLRASGLACEQARFGALFADELAARS